MEQTEWGVDTTRRVGKAVRALRDKAGRSAQWLSDRTDELGYRVSRARIADIEGKNRGGELKISELIILARACEIPPIMLLYPGLPDTDVEYAPGDVVPSWTALQYFTGVEAHVPKPGEEATFELHLHVNALNAIRQYYDAFDELEFLKQQLVEVMVKAANKGEPDTYDRDKDPTGWAEATQAQRAVGTTETALRATEQSVIRWRQKMRDFGYTPPSATDYLEGTGDQQ